MKEHKHTPGPWTLETVKTSIGFCHKVGPFPWGHEKLNHACIYVDYGSHEGVLLANARLIAAAPDLLEALEGLLALNDEMEALEVQHRWMTAIAAKARATQGEE